MKKKSPEWLPDEDGLFAGAKLSDRAYWLPLVDQMLPAPWGDALEAIDQGDYAPLLAALKAIVPPEVYPHLEDLFERKKLVARNPGNPKDPSYLPSLRKRFLARAKQSVYEFAAEEKLTIKESVKRVAKEWKILPEILQAYCDDPNRVDRRRKKRRSKKRLKKNRRKAP